MLNFNTPLIVLSIAFAVLFSSSLYHLFPTKPSPDPDPPTPTAMDPIPHPNPNPDADDLIYEFPGALRYYRSGRAERLDGTEAVPTGTDPITSVTSKEITLNPSTGLSVRIYLPNTVNQGNNNKVKVPVILFVHGGAFLIHTAGSPGYHRYCNLLAASTGSVVVSLSYRLAPEHTVPAAYEDAWEALKWLLRNCKSGNEPWLAEHGDLNKVFLAGDSAGGNIVHNIAVKFGEEEEGLEGCSKLKGIMLLNPYFWSGDSIGDERTEIGLQAWMEETWGFICGKKYNINHPFVHPMGSPDQALAKLGCQRVMVTVAELDMFVHRGRAYAQALRESAWEGEVELYEVPGEDHVYFLTKFDGENAVKQMEALAAFINKE